MTHDLVHYGIPGMHWGRRKGSSSSSPSQDHITANSLKGKKLEEMTNDEIRTVASRIQLEKAYKEATKKQLSPGQRIAGEILVGAGKQVATKMVVDVMSKGMDKFVKSMSKKS